MTRATKIESPGRLGPEAQEICQALLRMDTTNPPGNERPAAMYLHGKLQDVGIEATLLESAPDRANLVCRHSGTGEAAPLLLTAHLDVVGASAEGWRYPPFSGAEAEGCLWGRGAVDMKHMAAMCTAVMRRLAQDRPILARDVIFAAVADEEAGGDQGLRFGSRFGSRFLVDEYPELVRAEYALGAGGGFSLHLGGTTYYPVLVDAIPGTAEVLTDGHTLPGHDLLGELRQVLGPEVELEAVRSMPPVVTAPAPAPLFDVIARQIEQREPGAVVVPYLAPGYTDAKHFSRLGIKWYGFAPLELERGSGMRFADLFHGRDERVPIAGLRWGVEVLYAVIMEFCAPAADSA